MGEIHHRTIRDRHWKWRFLIVAMDYFSKWVESKDLARIRDVDIFTFIFQNIICRFGIPAEIVSDNGRQLQGKILTCSLTPSRSERTNPLPFTPRVMDILKLVTRPSLSPSRKPWTNTKDDGMSNCTVPCGHTEPLEDLQLENPHSYSLMESMQ
ncbi:uncharacterized protein LOC113345259 [Papaver somniferum]|uniref:uncharacterized protein LOC113345259 n=1 Tax=Papaver somniferum TaxID=3469 RepID=UPI000E6F9992|nr:uncharacterized protein LOC113345259 [Papaver somniferum]